MPNGGANPHSDSDRCVLVFSKLYAPAFHLVSFFRNGSWFCCSLSIVNFIAAYKLFRCSENSCSLVSPCGHITEVSSAYLIQSFGLCVEVVMAFSPRNFIKRFARAGDRGDPIAAPWTCLYRWPSYVKYVVERQWFVNSSICSGILYIVWIIVRASPTGTWVKGETTLKLTIISSLSSCCSLISSMKWL